MAKADRGCCWKTLWWCLVLVSCAFINGGMGYTLSIISALGTDEVQQFYGISSSKYFVLLFVFTLPDLVFPILAGLMIDHSLGPRYAQSSLPRLSSHRADSWSLVLFFLVSFLGQAIWNISGALTPPSFHVALVGYMILG